MAVTAALATAIPGSVQAQTSSYLDFDQLTGEFRSLANGSNLASMRSLGTSLEGREIWLIELGSPSGEALDERPGVLVVGNLAGDHVVGSQLALETVRYLLGEGSEVLDDHVVYVVPRLNPDGAEGMFAAVKAARRGNAV